MSSYREVQADYPGRCAACLERFPEGTWIVKTASGWAHEMCIGPVRTRKMTPEERNRYGLD